MKTGASLKDLASHFTEEGSQEKVIKEGEHSTVSKYRIFTEDEITELKRGITNWSDRMKEESNFLYRLKYSGGMITPTLIEGVIESLEASDDFEITSFGHSKFILFIGGNQPPLGKDINPKMWVFKILNDLRKNALKRLENGIFLVLSSGGYSYCISESGNQWVLSESQRNTLPVTLKPDFIFWLRTWGERGTKS